MKNKFLVVILLIVVVVLGVLVGMKCLKQDEVAKNNLEEKVMVTTTRPSSCTS